MSLYFSSLHHFFHGRFKLLPFIIILFFNVSVKLQTMNTINLIRMFDISKRTIIITKYKMIVLVEF